MRCWWWVVGMWLGLSQVAAAASAVSAPPLRPPAWVLLDADSGVILDESDADAAYTSGALNQLMVLLLALEQADLKLLPLAVPVTVSPMAVQSSPWARRIPLRSDLTYELSDLLKAVALSAADDAAIAAAEAIGGSLEGCLELMNARAARLGLAATHYASVGGAHAGEVKPESADRSSPRDIARLVASLIRRPEMQVWSSLPGVPFAGGVALRNANQLVGGVAGVDGLQVALSRDARGRITGYDIVATAQRGALRLIAVVLGASDNAGRYGKAAELIEWGFANFEAVPLLTTGDRLGFTVEVENGVVAKIQPVAGQSVAFLRRHGEPLELTCRLQLPGRVPAPLLRDEVLGELVIEDGEQVVSIIPLLSPREVRAVGGFAPH